MELTDKVLIDNLCSWPLYFRRLNGVGDIRIPAKVTGNRMFVGNDPSRPGDHARLFIQNDAQRKALFGYADTTDDVLVLNADSVRELLAIRKKDEFNARLEALVTNDAEKKMIAQIAKENGGDDVAAWKMDAINKLAESVTL